MEAEFINQIVPTVGRMVYFNTRGSNDGVYPSRVLAAVITRVYNNDTISVCAFREAGSNNEIKISYGNKPGQWDWMPYQKGQAKKTEELEKAQSEMQETAK